MEGRAVGDRGAVARAHARVPRSGEGALCAAAGRRRAHAVARRRCGRRRRRRRRALSAGDGDAGAARAAAGVARRPRPLHRAALHGHAVGHDADPAHGGPACVARKGQGRLVGRAAPAGRGARAAKTPAAQRRRVRGRAEGVFVLCCNVSEKRSYKTLCLPVRMACCLACRAHHH